jgi:hypothetical protein
MTTTDLEQRITEIQRMNWTELRALWRDIYKEEPRSGNVQWMRKRLCWQVQAEVLGGLSDAAKKRIEELTPLALQWLPWGFRSFPEKNTVVSPAERGRLKPGTVLTRPYKSKTVVVNVREDGFEYDGALFRSLSAVAKAVTGSHWNGRLFFFGRERKDDAASA